MNCSVRSSSVGCGEGFVDVVRWGGSSRGGEGFVDVVRWGGSSGGGEGFVDVVRWGGSSRGGEGDEFSWWMMEMVVAEEGAESKEFLKGVRLISNDSKLSESEVQVIYELVQLWIELRWWDGEMDGWGRESIEMGLFVCMLGGTWLVEIEIDDCGGNGNESLESDESREITSEIDFFGWSWTWSFGSVDGLDGVSMGRLIGVEMDRGFCSSLAGRLIGEETDGAFFSSLIGLIGDDETDGAFFSSLVDLIGDEEADGAFFSSFAGLTDDETDWLSLFSFAGRLAGLRDANLFLYFVLFSFWKVVSIKWIKLAFSAEQFAPSIEMIESVEVRESE